MNRSVKMFLKIFLSVTLCCVMIVAGVVAGALLGLIDTSAGLNVEDIQLNFTSFVYATDPETGEVTEFERLYGEENRVWVDYADIPQHVVDAAVAIEDERFYSHGGVDLRSTAKAVFQYVFQKSTSRGASTITQQLVKNLSGEDEKTPVRKVQEMLRAINLEQKLTKEQVMELYLNTIYLSQGCSGIGSAADFYFGKDVTELTIAEGASLVGITQYPSLYDPVQRPDKNKEKQEIVLKKMLELGKIDQRQYEQAVAEPLRITAAAKRQEGTKQSYFVDEVVFEVLRDLQTQRGYSKAIAVKMLYSGGLKIYATVDPVVQQVLNEVYQDDSNFLKAPGNEQPESAMTIIDPATGHIKGLVGGRGKKNASLTLNRATQSKRQPGSTIKPLAVYCPALENNLITPASVYVDKEIRYGDWAPKNYYSGFRGAMTIKYAVEQSVNTVPVQLLKQMGVSTSYDFLTNNLHVSTLVDDDRTLPSLALGGLTHGMTNKELTAAYAAIANRGIYNKPVTYTKVLDHSGKVLLEQKNVSSVAMSEKTAGTMLGMLVSVVSNGTGTPARFSSRYAIAGKTGTTDGDKDRWFVGMTPYYVGTVWYGFDAPKDMSFVRSNPTIPVWRKVMTEIHSRKNLAPKQFANITYSPVSSEPARTEPSEEGEQIYLVCTESEKRAREGCPSTRPVDDVKTLQTLSYCTLHGGSERGPDSGPESSPHKTEDGGSATKPSSTPRPTASAKPTSSPKPSNIPSGLAD